MKKLVIYNDLPHETKILEKEIEECLRETFATTFLEAKETIEEDEISKYRVSIIVEVDH